MAPCTAPDAPFDISFVADGFTPGGSVRVGIYVPSGTTQIVSDPLTADDQGHVAEVRLPTGHLRNLCQSFFI